MENGTCTVLWRTPRLFLRLDRGPRVAWPPLSPVSDRDAAGDRRAHLRAPEPGSPDAHPAPEDGRALSESLAILQHLAARDLCRKLGYPQGSAEFDELNFALALLHTECHSAWGALFYLEDADATTTARALTRAARAYGRIDKLLGDRKWLAGEGPSVADAYLAGTARWGRELGYFDLQHDFPRLHRHRRSWSRTRRCASPMPSRIACRRRAAGSSGRGDTGRSGEPPARLKSASASASAGPATVTCPWLRAGAPPARPRPATDRRPGSGLRRWRRARPGVRPG